MSTVWIISATSCRPAKPYDDGEVMASMVQDSGHDWDDFFIFAASGTDDFAYSSFKNQIEAMAGENSGTFRYADQ